MSGEAGETADRAHMVALCRKLGAPEPGPDARAGVVAAGGWNLRWERRTEASTWTVFAPAGLSSAPFAQTALELVPRDWLAALPGEVLAAVHVLLVTERPTDMPFAENELIGSNVAGGALSVFTDFRPGPDSFTRFVLVQRQHGTAVAGRMLQQIFEIETYRMLAMLAFPLASATTRTLSRLEAEAADAAVQITEAGGVEDDRALLARLAALAAEAEAMAAATSFRFSAARAYDGLVHERIDQLDERPLPGYPTLGQFMERRLAPAMRTCQAVAERQRDVIERLARTTQMLNTRVEVAAEVTNVGLLASMDRRSQLQLRLQQTVEGLSVAAIAYYALGLLGFVFNGAAEVIEGFNARLATGIAAPFVVLVVWRVLRRAYANLRQAEDR